MPQTVSIALILLLGAFSGFWMAHWHYKRLLRADNKAKILSSREKAQAKWAGEQVVKLDFPSLLADMEARFKLWSGHKHQKRVGVWINWIKCILDKGGNTKK